MGLFLSFISYIAHKHLPKLNTLHYKDKYTLIYPSEKSKYGYNVPLLVLEETKKPPDFHIRTMPLMFKAAGEVRKSYKRLKKNNFVGKQVMSVEDFYKISNYAKTLGVHQIGVTKLDHSDIFSNHAVLYDNAIVFTMEMRASEIDKAPSRDTGHEVHRTYYELGDIVNKVGSMMIHLGYNVQSNAPLGGDINFVTTAKKANLGEVGLHGILISKEVGPRQRIAAVFTKASLENITLDNNEDYSWINEFCDSCKRCAKTCPGEAIYYNASKDNLETRIDNKKCAVPFGLTSGCSVCIKMCPFHKSDYNFIKEKYYKRKSKTM